MLLTAVFFASAIAAQPPQADNDHDAIFHATRAALDALVAGDRDVAGAWLTENAQMIVVDAREDGDPKIRIRTFTAMLDHMDPMPEQREPLGKPLILQDGALAQVWVPYSFWSEGEKQHCGSDNFTLVRHTAGWRIASLSFTMVPLDRCDALAAPQTPGD